MFVKEAAGTRHIAAQYTKFLNGVLDTRPISQAIMPSQAHILFAEFLIMKLHGPKRLMRQWNTIILLKIPYLNRKGTDAGMFDTVGKDYGHMRKENTLKKLERMRKTLSHQEPDRVPISDFFWGSFIERWRKDLGLADDTNPYFHYDLDWIVTLPNMDPFIRSFEILKESREEG